VGGWSEARLLPVIRADTSDRYFFQTHKLELPKLYGAPVAKPLHDLNRLPLAAQVGEQIRELLSFQYGFKSLWHQ
jgi:hypothetical protein